MNKCFTRPKAVVNRCVCVFVSFHDLMEGLSCWAPFSASPSQQLQYSQFMTVGISRETSDRVDHLGNTVHRWKSPVLHTAGTLTWHKAFTIHLSFKSCFLNSRINRSDSDLQILQRTPTNLSQGWVSQAWMCSLPTGGGGPSSFNSHSVSLWMLPKTCQRLPAEKCCASRPDDFLMHQWRAPSPELRRGSWWWAWGYLLELHLVQKFRKT